MRVLKVAGYALAGVAVLVLFAAAGAFAASEAMIRWPVTGADKTVRLVSAKAGSAERGARLARLNGCHDCHGDRLEGRLFHDEMPVLRAWGPNLTRVAARDSDAELDAAIRRGVGGDGRRLWVMPSNAFAQLNDQETADLIAYIRSFPVTGEDQPHLQVGHLGRLGVLLGKFSSEPAMLKAGPPILADYGPQHAQGRDVARLCVECHGPDLKGMPLLKSPDLTMAASYEAADFQRLLHDGVAAGDRKLEGLMGSIARTRFSVLTDAEIAALYGYLKARAEREIAAAQ
ncbi:cytochrome c [Phenylobacterium sp. J426]|uniref:cytochrome c n=1 Tax=Phenylobacterium sp. J426 TaxID=2898439 RepID=UPI002150CF84|nr:cytochrome c [Phenylobacterium sp. J426]MCR5874566.1 cytochrome c [Phenylobacterium sp. J426]